ncbi:helix-turn-helix domain-containing protein [Hymenobacter negativus]|uniref:XRE family transcriptional regulator n=1 Tax=Hymenobacter negativus TaxID=2795026 RepID=A0ABS3QMN6_9BACT|nr:helix-turn-helix domain-containing protein [Hymenobacter negativus]MBO2012491.1 hypothetical protein [Hymenobacter negativus]
MSYSAQLRAVRAHYGFSQAGLAPWLGLGRAQLASIETGREQLPARARPWLRPWVAALAEAEAEAAPLPEAAPALPELAVAHTAVRARWAECHYQARRLGQQLAALRTAHRTAARRLAAGPLLQAALPAPASAEPLPLALRRRWLARLLEAATDTLAPEAPGSPLAALLEAHRQGYLHEAAWLARQSGGSF